MNVTFKNVLIFGCLYRRISSKLYLHRNEQFLDLTGRMGYKISLGERTEAQVKSLTREKIRSSNGKIRKKAQKIIAERVRNPQGYGEIDLLVYFPLSPTYQSWIVRFQTCRQVEAI